MQSLPSPRAKTARLAAPPELWLISRVFPPDEGGVQTYAQAIARNYAELGWRVRVFTKTSLGPRRVRDGALDITDVGDDSKLRVYIKLAIALARARRQAARDQRLPTALHACTWRAAIVPVLLGFKPLTITVHGREIGRPSGLDAWLMRRVLGAAQRVVAVSKWTQRHLLARLPELAPRCVVAWNGLSDFAAAVPEISRTDSDEPLVFSVCRLVPRKNLRAALAAAAICAQRGYRFRYWIAGRGPEMAALQADVAALGLSAHVRLLGYVSDEELAQLHGRADVFLHPQIELEDGAEMEGFGITIADAMACATPCIVGAHGGPAELVAHGRTGHVVDGNDIEAIADALAEVLQDVPLRQRLGRAARDWTRQNLCWRRHCIDAAGTPGAAT